MALPRIPRKQWLNSLRWPQGEHCVLIGQTGTGKTSLAHELLNLRQWAVVLAIKKSDDTLESFKRDYTLIKTWPPPYGINRALLWCKPTSLDPPALAKQRTALYSALDDIYQSGGWGVYFDDAGYMAGLLKLSMPMTVFLSQGRSSHISAVLSMTRPASQLQRVPLESMTQVKHTYLFRLPDRREHVRAAQIASMPLRSFTDENEQLGPFDFIAVDNGRAQIVTAR